MARNKQRIDVDLDDFFDEKKIQTERNIIRLFNFSLPRETFKALLPIIVSLETQLKQSQKGNLPSQLLNFFQMFHNAYLDIIKQEYILTVPFDHIDIIIKIITEFQGNASHGIEKALYDNTHIPGYKLFIIKKKTHWFKKGIQNFLNNISSFLLNYVPAIVKTEATILTSLLYLQPKFEILRKNIEKSLFFSKYV